MFTKGSRSTSSEVHAYVYINQELTKKKGWSSTQVYTQQECQQIAEIKKCLGLLKPENVVKITESQFYIIEAKNERKKIDLALKEAKEYAELINGKSQVIESRFVTGIAGNRDEGFIAKSAYFSKSGYWEIITENSVEVTSLLSRSQIERVVLTTTASLTDVEITDKEFFEAAEKINEILHENSINKDYRARFISTILLALSDGAEINLDESSTSVLISTINAKADAILNRHRKRDFARFIKIDEPSNSDNHVKVKAAIIQTIQELLSLNIRSAMKSGRDVLGEFYEVFLKYGNGAKDIGIVLTPRHITRFAAEVLNIGQNDLVFDPTCGTGGFLVAAFDEVRKKNPTEKELDNFKSNGLYGIEEQDPVIALAIVNMIFRGDGKNNMIEGNCFNKYLHLESTQEGLKASYSGKEFSERIPPITKVLMNPPFAQKSSKNKEYHFINQALNQMQEGGVLFSVLPSSVLFEKSTKQWRRDLLKSHTLLSVIIFPTDLFYPTSTHTVGLILKKGIPHKKDDLVFWIRTQQDGYLKKKGKRLKSENEKDELSLVKDELKRWIENPRLVTVENIPEFKKVTRIDFDNDDFELVPEAYLDDKEPTFLEIKSEIENLVKQTAGYLLDLGDREINIKAKSSLVPSTPNIGYFNLYPDLCSVERKYAPYLNELDSDDGNVPYVTTTEQNNGISLRCDSEPNFDKYSLTVSLDGSCGTTFYQFENFISGEKTAVLLPQKSDDHELMFYIGALIRIKAWRYNYGRKLSMARLKQFKLALPVNKDGDIDMLTIKTVVINSYGWEIVESHLN